LMQAGWAGRQDTAFTSTSLQSGVYSLQSPVYSLQSAVESQSLN
jgi:hypothetical protein